MSLSPRFWTDPKDGVIYAMRERLKSSQKNEHVTGLRNLDLVLEKMIAQNWLHTANPSGMNSYPYGAAYSSYDGLYAIAGQNSSVPAIITSPDGYNWTSRTVPASTATSLRSIVVVRPDSSGNFVAGANDGTTRRSSSNGATWTEYATGSSSPIRVWFDATNDLVITCENGRGSARSSTAGLSYTWNATALPSAFAGATETRGCHGNGVNIVTGSTLSVCARSTDGVTWSEIAMPASGDWGSGLCYAEKLGKFFATDSSTSGRTAYSTDGTSWTLEAGTQRPSGTAFSQIQSSGNVLLAAGDDVLLMMSDDEGDSWRTVGGVNGTVYDIEYCEDNTDVGGRYVVCVRVGEADPEIIMGLRVQL